MEQAVVKQFVNADAVQRHTHSGHTERKRVGRSKSRHAGFTIVELLIAMSILITLFAAGMAIYGKVRQKQEVTSIMDFTHALEVAVETFRNDTGYIPNDFTVLWDKSKFTDTDYAGCNPDNWAGPYLNPPAQAAGTTTDRLYTPTGRAVEWVKDVEVPMQQGSLKVHMYGIVIKHVPKEICQLVDRKIDNKQDDKSGKVAYANTLTVNNGQLTYPTGGCNQNYCDLFIAIGDNGGGVTSS